MRSSGWWGLFFVWLGIAFLADVGIGIGLLGVGVITLGEQAARRALSVAVERFWVLVGLGFTLAGIWELAEISVPLVPLLLIAAGIAIVWSGTRGHHLVRRH